jgi:hypothetical protein
MRVIDSIGGCEASFKRRRAVNCSKRRIGTGLVLMDADVVLHRGICLMRLPRLFAANSRLGR